MTSGMFAGSRFARVLVLAPLVLFLALAPALVAVPGERFEEEKEASKEAQEESSEELEIKAQRPSHRAPRVRPPPVAPARPPLRVAARRPASRSGPVPTGRPAVPTPLLC
jgi:hypothetical protein